MSKATQRAKAISQKFTFWAVPEITVTLQDVFSLEMNEAYPTQPRAMRDVLRQLAGSGRGQVFSQRAAAAVPVCVASVGGGSGERENPLSK